MTGDEFSNRFRLVEKLTDTGVTTYRGVDSRRGGVLVHLMPGPDTATPETLAEHGVTLAAIDELAYHECLDVEGMRVVVTTELDDFTTYESWIEEVEQRARAFGGAVAEPEVTETGEEPAGRTTSAGKEEPTAAVEPPVEGDGVGEPLEGNGSETVGERTEDAEAPGEFTRLFEASEAAGDAAPPPPPEPAPPDESPPPGPPPAAPPEGTRPEGETAAEGEGDSVDRAPGGPGEYTRIMMQLEGIEVPRKTSEPSDSTAAPAPSDPPMTSEPPPPAPSEPSEPPASSGASPSGPPPPDGPAGREPELTTGPDAGGGAGVGGEDGGLPESEKAREAQEARKARERKPVSEREGDEGPGPYTRLMRRSAGGEAEESPSRDRRGFSGAPLSPEPEESHGYLDRLRGTGRREETPPPSRPPESSDDRSGTGAPAPPGPASPPPASSGPSEYTRIIRGDRGGRTARRPEAPSSAGAPPAPAGAPSSSGSSRKPIVIALVVVVVLLAAILIYFATWGAPGGA